MSSNTYSLFLRDTPNCCSIYAGNYGDLATAQQSGGLVYNISLRKASLIVSSQNIDIPDDMTVVQGMTESGYGTGAATLVGDMNQQKGASGQIAIQEQDAVIEQREKGTGWKFTSSSGARYKWEVLHAEKYLELHSDQGKIVASIRGGPRWDGIFSSISVSEEIDEDLRMLVFISGAFSVKALCMINSEHANKVVGKTNLSDLKGMSRLHIFAFFATALIGGY